MIMWFHLRSRMVHLKAGDFSCLDAVEKIKEAVGASGKRASKFKPKPKAQGRAKDKGRNKKRMKESEGQKMLHLIMINLLERGRRYPRNLIKLLLRLPRSSLVRLNEKDVWISLCLKWWRMNFIFTGCQLGI